MLRTVRTGIVYGLFSKGMGVLYYIRGIKQALMSY